jgi:hypothetical protein
MYKLFLKFTHLFCNIFKNQTVVLYLLEINEQNYSPRASLVP